MKISPPRIVGELREWRFNSELPGYEGKLYGDFFKKIADGTSVKFFSYELAENTEHAVLHILKLHDGRQFMCYKLHMLPEV